jgi:hypothetical protein
VSGRDFAVDLGGSHKADVRSAFDECYRRFFPADCIADVEVVGRTQQQLGDVRIVMRDAGPATSRVWVEEKLRSRPWEDILLEYQHVGQDGRAWLGWVYSTNADWLAYGWLDEHDLEVRMLPTRALREWFTPRLHDFPDVTSTTDGRGRYGSYTTYNKAIPLEHSDFRDFCRLYAVRPLRVEVVPFV